MGIWQIPWCEGPEHSWQAKLDAGSSGGLETVLTKMDTDSGLGFTFLM